MRNFLIAAYILCCLSGPAQSFTRIGLDADITFYVDLTLPSSGDCLTPETACSTDQDAIDLVATRYDLGGKTATILRVSAQTGTVGVEFWPFTGGGKSRVIFDINGGAIIVSSGSAVVNRGGPGTASLYLKGGTLRTTDPQGYCVLWQISGKVFLESSMIYNGCGQAAISSAATGSVVQIDTTLQISGGATRVLLAGAGGMIYGTDAPTTVIFTNNPTIAYYAQMMEIGGIQTLNWNYYGAANVSYRCVATKGGHFLATGGVPPGSNVYNDSSSTCQ